MKLKFFIAGMAIVAGLASAVSCQDLSKDLTALQNKVNSLESTVQALQSKIDAGAVITSVTPSNSGIIITLSNGNKYEITDGVNGKDGANGKDGKDGKDGAPGSVVTIGENGNWFIDGEDTGLAAQGPAGADGEAGTPGEYYVPNPETGCFDKYVWVEENGVGAYVKEATTISFIAPGTITAVYNPLTGVVTLYGIEGYEGGYEIGGNHAADVTSIELVSSAAGVSFMDADFTKVIEKENVFGPAGDQIVFTADKEVERNATLIVKVTPASTTLSKSDVAIINSKGETYDKLEVLDVKLYDDVLTKAADYALWEVVIGLSEYVEDEFEDACGTGVWGDRVAFAIKIGDAVTGYDMYFTHSNYAPSKVLNLAGYGVGDLQMPIYVNSQDINTLKNRVLGSVNDYAWANTRKSVATPDVAPVTSGTARNIRMATSTTAYKDNRTGAAYNYLNANVGKPIVIAFDTDIYKAAYVELDTKTCDPDDPSEKNAWESYKIEGLNELSTDGTIKVLTSDPAADNDIIGFRVHLVNWDGTLADPDGIAFYAVYGENSEDVWDAVATTITPSKANSYGSDWSAVATVSFGKKLTNVAKVQLDMDDATAPDFKVSLCKADGTNLTTVTAGAAPVAWTGTYSDWKAIKTQPTATGTAALGYLNYIDDEEYTGTVTLLDDKNFVLATIPVSMKKVLPTDAPSAVKKAFSFRTGAFNKDGVFDKVVPGVLDAATIWGALRAGTTNRRKAMNTAASGAPKAQATWLYYEFTNNGTLDMSDVYNYTAPTGTTLAELITTFDGAQKYYVYDATYTVLNQFTDDDYAVGLNGTTYTTLIAGGYMGNLEVQGMPAAVTLRLGAVNNTENTAYVGYDYGYISATLDADDNVVPADVLKYFTSYKYRFSSTFGQTKWDWNWLMGDVAVAFGTETAAEYGAFAGSVPAVANWSAEAPTHAARYFYWWMSKDAGWQLFGTAGAPTPWTVTPGATAGTYTNKWSDDPFKVNAAPQITYAPGVDIAAFGKSVGTLPLHYIANEQGVRLNTFIATPAANQFAFIPADGAVQWTSAAASNFQPGKLVSSNGVEEYYVATQASASDATFYLTSTGVSAPINDVNCTFTIQVYDEFDNLYKIELPVVIKK